MRMVYMQRGTATLVPGFRRAQVSRALACLLVAACATTSEYAVFTRYSPLSRNAEIARRVLPPLTHRRIAGAKLAEQAIDLAREKFDVYVPHGAPPTEGYGLVVFIAPWAAPTQPRRWRAALDDHGLIFVSPRDAGNDRSVLDRRLPLALLAYENVRARFRLDASRIYVAGFSGGSRVAETAALAYPDVFRGALLNAGADPIDGQNGIYKPPVELFRRFQHSRLVYVTGELDTDNLRQDDVSERSMRAACVLDVRTVFALHLGHEALDQLSWARALDALDAPRAVDEAELARCNARVDAELAAQLAAVAATVAHGDRAAARDQLNALDARFGGLAAPAILELAAKNAE